MKKLQNGLKKIDNNETRVSFEEWRKNIMNDMYRLEVDTGNGGYGFTDTLAELLADVKLEYGKKEVEKVSIWTKSSKEGDEYVSEDKRMHIWNIGKG